MSEPGTTPPSGWRGRYEDGRERAQHAAEDAKTRYERLREEWPPLDYAASVVERYLDSNGSIVAGYLAYRLFLLVLPLMVIVVAVSGLSPDTTQEASQHLKLGKSIANTIATAGNQAGEGRLALLFTGLLGFVVAAWGLLSALQFASAQAWRIPTRKFPGKARTFMRLTGSVLLLGVVLYVSALIRNAGPVAGLAGSLTAVASATVAYFGLGWILPRRAQEWFWVLPGAAVGGILQTLLQLVVTLYLPEKLAGMSQTYGALGITLTALSYLYLLGLNFMLVSTVNAVIWERHRHDPPGILRRVAEKLPIPTTTFGSGYVAEGDSVETSVPLSDSSASAAS